VLLLYGDRDRVVPPQASATIVAETLERAGNRAYSVRMFPGANHAMVLAEDGFTSFADYHRGVAHPPGYLDTMTAWMRRPAAGTAVAADHGRAPGPVERLRSVDGRPWHESLAIQLGLLALFLTVFLAWSLAGLTRWLRRRRRHSPAIQPPGVRRARTLAAVLSPLALLLLVAAAVVMVGYPSEPLVLVRRALQGWAVVVAALSILLVASTAWAWSQFPTVRARLGHGLMAATAALFVVFLGSWRLLG
jgi:uncharacterized protein